MDRRQPPRAVWADAALLGDFQRLLEGEGQGVLLDWPRFGALTQTHRQGYRHDGR